MTDGLVLVARFVDWSEAHMARGLLEANGIRAVLYDGNLISVDWPMALAIGGVRLMVPDAQAQEGRMLLREVAAGAFLHDAEAQMPAPPGEDPAIERCPACSSESVFRPRSFLSALIGSLLAAPILWTTRRRVCRHCGNEWLTPDPAAAAEASVQTQGPRR